MVMLLSSAPCTETVPAPVTTFDLMSPASGAEAGGQAADQAADAAGVEYPQPEDEDPQWDPQWDNNTPDYSEEDGTAIRL